MGLFYFLLLDGGSRRNPGPGGTGSVIVQLHIQTHAACVMWVSSMEAGAADTTKILLNIGAHARPTTSEDKRLCTPALHWGQRTCALATSNASPSTQDTFDATLSRGTDRS